MSANNNGGPAFPTHERNMMTGHPDEQMAGMSLREYAAIKLRAPESGTDWLDDMIRKSLRDDLAAKAMQALIGDRRYQSLGEDLGWAEIAESELASETYELADAMLAARSEPSALSAADDLLRQACAAFEWVCAGEEVSRVEVARRLDQAIERATGFSAATTCSPGAAMWFATVAEGR